MINAQFHLLIVDDDQLIIDSLKMIVPSHWKVVACSQPDHLNLNFLYHAAFVDMHIHTQDKADGPQVINKLAKHSPQLPIVAISGNHSIDIMESCLKVGATRFLNKPLMPEEVLLVLEKIESSWLLKNTMSQNAKQHWIGQSAASEKVKQQIANLRGEKGPVLIEGETGTGKEVTAHAINSQEGQRSLVTVNVAALPENLFDSEFFGHIKGAFTGAEQNKVGLAEAAHGGDLFLDEIEALPLHLQVKLLRFLESGEIKKVGSKESSHVNVRVICASNQNLQQLVKEGKFREDLLWRLSGKKIELPPLRERKEDIPILAQFFLELERPRRNKKLSEEAGEALKKYSWPGNVRELKRVCEQLALVSPLPVIRASDVEPLMDSFQKPEEIQKKYDYSLGLAQLTEEFERKLIKDCHKENNENIESTCKILQISRATFYKKLKESVEEM